ncbi:MAG: CDP-glucose 4,6-dehydratase [Methanospirillaceae archaeon]|nr:CDP-glucose 4,6-dehydratase [Methanospirillaceae archaeon]
MNTLSSFNGKRVFITGHTGFKGSWLSLWLSQLGAEVFGYSLLPDTTPNNYSASFVGDLLSGETISDISDTNMLQSAIKKAEPDCIFHLAAQPLVRYSYDHPIPTFQTNVIGSLVLLEAVRIQGQPCSVVMVTSDKCYDNSGQIWGYRESDPLGGYDPYSASKAAAEIAISSYRRSFFPEDRIDEHGVQIATVRAGNVIGGGDWAADRIIPDAVRALSAQKCVQVRNPHAIRPWQHVLEPLFGYLTLGARMHEKRDPALSSAWNFGPLIYDECPVSFLMDLFCREWGDTSSWMHCKQRDAHHEAPILRLAIDKAIHQLQWRPGWNLDEAVKKTAVWYREYYYGGAESMQDNCFRDIDAYMGSLS